MGYAGLKFATDHCMYHKNSHRFPLLIFLVVLCFSGAGAQVQCSVNEEQGLKVMTYNLRLDVASDGDNAWPHRRDFLANQVEFHAPDVLGIDGFITNYPDRVRQLAAE